ncbi:MAG: DJ-1/PfpI family protein, partial [Bacteroidota bacterium]
MANLNSKRVAILATDGVEQSEIQQPMAAIENAGADYHVLSPNGNGSIKAWNNNNWGEDIPVAKAIQDADPKDYDMLYLPGGTLNADSLRQEEYAINFSREFFVQGKPIAAICHGAQTLIETGMLENRRMTCYPAISTDVQNAGAIYENKELIVD